MNAKFGLRKDFKVFNILLKIAINMDLCAVNEMLLGHPNVGSLKHESFDRMQKETKTFSRTRSRCAFPPHRWSSVDGGYI